MSTMISIAPHENILRKIFVNDRYNRAGVYGVMICKDGEWADVIVDDYFPIARNGDLLFGQVL